MTDIDLHSTIDARVWASEFERLKIECEWMLDDIDEGLMITWFSNAMYTQEMHDRKETESLRRKLAAALAAIKVKDAFIEKVAKQAPEKPDYCERC